MMREGVMARTGSDFELIDAFNGVVAAGEADEIAPLDVPEMPPLPPEEDDMLAPMAGLRMRPLGVVGE